MCVRGFCEPCNEEVLNCDTCFGTFCSACRDVKECCRCAVFSCVECVDMPSCTYKVRDVLPRVIFSCSLTTLEAAPAARCSTCTDHATCTPYMVIQPQVTRAKPVFARIAMTQHGAPDAATTIAQTAQTSRRVLVAAPKRAQHVPSSHTHQTVRWLLIPGVFASVGRSTTLTWPSSCAFACGTLASSAPQH